VVEHAQVLKASVLLRIGAMYESVPHPADRETAPTPGSVGAARSSRR